MGCSFPLVDSTAQANRCSLRTALGVGRAWRRGAGKVAGDWQGGGVQDSAPSSGWTATLQTTTSLRPPHMQRSVWRSEHQNYCSDRIVELLGFPSANVKPGPDNATDRAWEESMTVSRWPSVLYDLQREPGLLCSGSDQSVFGRVSRVSGILFRLI